MKSEDPSPNARSRAILQSLRVPVIGAPMFLVSGPTS